MILFLIYFFYIIFYWENLDYFLVTGVGLFFVFYIVSIYIYHKKSHKISLNPTPEKIKRLEIKNNIYSFIIYFFIVGGLFIAYQKGFFTFDFSLNFGVIPYMIILIIFHDAYFFFLHKLLHTKFFYKKIHIDHHKSVHPTIFSAYNFHPIEAVLYTFAFFPAFFINLNFYAFLFAVFFNDLLNFLGHSGYEIFEKRPKNWFFKYFVSTTYHDLHHSNNKGNFALYFSWWDKIFKSYDQKYEEK